MKKCNGDMCSNEIEDDETLCKECKHLLQRCISIYLNKFNEKEKEYIIKYVKGIGE